MTTDRSVSSVHMYSLQTWVYSLVSWLKNRRIPNCHFLEEKSQINVIAGQKNLGMRSSRVWFFFYYNVLYYYPPETKLFKQCSQCFKKKNFLPCFAGCKSCAPISELWNNEEWYICNLFLCLTKWANCVFAKCSNDQTLFHKFLISFVMGFLCMF